MERRTEKLIQDIQEQLKFYAQLGVEFIPSPPSRETISSPSLEKRILECRRCPLWGERKNAVPGEGDIEADLMFVGEAPGRDEDIQGRPFVGKAGQLLTRIIEAMNFRRDEVYITNVIKCRPPHNRNPRREEIEKCQGYLLEQIKMINPQVIVSLGKVATEFFTQSRLSISALRGKFHPYGSIKIMPTFHPSYIVRNEENRKIKKMVWEDMKEVMALLGKK
ncbi:MAG: uracil-DNA glycosylase [Candidatus Aminicenantes bacterium]